MKLLNKEKFADAFELDIGLPKITIIAQREVSVENHLGIMEYGEDLMRVRLEGGSLCVLGVGLELNLITDEELQITGQIKSIEFQE